MRSEDTQPTYNATVVRQFAWMTVLWGIVGMGIGVWLAAELAFPNLNFGMPWLNFGRLRPLHTTLLIFGFGGCALFATSYHVVQRTSYTALFQNSLATFTFWGWQLVLVLAILTLPQGITSGKEYAELEWPIDLLIAVVWSAYAVVFFGTIVRRKVPYIFISNWFFGAAILAFFVLHLVNSAALPLTLWTMKSYSFYPGAVDALVEWWYGHGVLFFLLGVSFLGTMYYFLPWQAKRPIHSYRLAVVHFWTMIALVLWTGPQHLLYSALPDWTQSLGMVFGVLLLIPVWGGLVNALLTLSGAWHTLRTDPILRFMVTALIFYGLSSLDGSLLAIRTLNLFAHDTKLIVAHAHAGALGWSGFLIISSIYALMPRLYEREHLYSTRLVSVHFSLALAGLLLQLIALGGAGIVQGMSWSALNEDATLTYGFRDSVQLAHWFYVLGVLGGLLSLTGMGLMAYNIRKTIGHEEAHA